jgi:hypothetical protein
MPCNSTVARHLSVCSRHGYFSVTKMPNCQCDIGWTGKINFRSYAVSPTITNCVTVLIEHFTISFAGEGDFTTSSGLECYMDLRALDVLSIVVICFTTVCNLLTFRVFIYRSMSKTISFCSTDPKSLFPIFFLLHGIGDFLFAVLKLHSQHRSIVGRDAPVTVIAALLPILCYCGLVLYSRVVMKFLKGYSCMMTPESRGKVDRRFASLQSKALLIPLLAIVPCSLPLFSMGYPQYVRVFGMAYLIGNGLLAICYGGFFYLALGFLLEELTSYIKTSTTVADDILTVYKRLKLAHRVGTPLFLTLGASSMLFGSHEDLIRHSSYFVLIVQILIHPILTILTLTVSHISHRKVVNMGPSFTFAIVAEHPSVHTETSV